MKLNYCLGAYSIMLTAGFASEWNSNPPAATQLTYREPIPGAATRSAFVEVHLSGKDLPNQIPLHLDKSKRSLRDDGQGGDAMAGDGIYSAEVPFDPAPLELLTNSALKTDSLRMDGQHLRHSRFAGREQLADVPVAPFDPKAWQEGKAVPLQAFRTTADANLIWDRSLMITHPGVVDNVEASGMGAWSFGHLFSELARAYNVSPTELVRRWLANWEHDQVINGFPLPKRGGVTAMIDKWKLSGFDPAQAPFRLLAIVHRIDLRQDILLGGPGSAGENRFVFCAVDPNGSPLSFTVIFEYGIQVTYAEEVRQEAIKWANLQAWQPGTPIYNDNLKILTEETVRVGDSGHSRLDQLRTNEIALGSPWQIREFKLSNGPDDRGFFRQTTTKQTPDNSLSGNDTLAAWITANGVAILGDRHVIPATLPPTSTGADFFSVLTGGSDETGVVWMNGKNLPAPVRHHFALNTCNGCHQGETGTSFTHVFPRSAGSASTLSGFMTGIDVEDPGAPGFKRHFDEKTRRCDDFDMLVNFPIIFQLGHEPLVMTH